MNRISRCAIVLPILTLLVVGCSNNNSSDLSADTSQFNPNLDDVIPTGEPGGDTTSIAGLWDGTTSVADGEDVVYWDLASNGVLTRYDYQQDSGEGASGENCYIVGESITVTPEGADDYSIQNVAVAAAIADESLTISFLEPDKNDLNGNGDVDETPVFRWNKLTTPVLQDLNSCMSDTDMEVTQNQQPSETFFNGSFDNEVKVGDGIAFLRLSNSALHIRGLWGQSQRYYQVDIEVFQTADGTYPLDGNQANASISEIVGDDAVGVTYSATVDASNTLAFQWNQDIGQIMGDFSFTVVDSESDISVNGEFNISISESSDWDCDFGDEVITACRFL